MHEETMKEALERELEQCQFIRFREEDAKEVLALIAVNEKLLEALKEITSVAKQVDSWQSFPSDPIEVADAAIALAEAK